ncbi:MAG: response regulator [Peptococcaceae bacterium]|nr:response regulator [Peptococcaceae bacterium]
MSQEFTALIEDQKKQISDLKKEHKKDQREISRLRSELMQARVIANVRVNQVAAITCAQRERDRYLQMLMHASSNVLLFFDPSQRVVFCTDVLLRLLKAADITFVSGRRIDEIFIGIHQQDFVRELSAKVQEVISLNEMMVFAGALGFSSQEDVRQYTIDIWPMRDDEGENKGAIVLFHDVTEIEQSRYEAVQANEAKSRFLSNMSHEIRTPLNAIIGMTSIARETDDAERKDYCLKKIVEASNHLLGVINDILDISKIEANKMELFLQNFVFEQAVQNAVNVNLFRIEEKQQEFSVRLDKDIPRVLWGDDQRLTQVITNLLSNAMKFTPFNGKISLAARLLHEEDMTCTIQIEITDTGIGLSKEQQSKLFTSFEQADSGTSSKYGGTGLGLALCKNIVKMLHGDLWVKSEMDQGSTFGFTMQIQRGDESGQSSLRPNICWENMRILMVDDEPVLREYFYDTVSQMNVYCDVAGSGAEALQLIKEHAEPYDSFFIDWNLPDMSGGELIERIKREQFCPSVMIIVSGNEWGRIKDDAKRVGVDRFLAKPMFISDIVDCLNECMGVVQASAVQDLRLSDEVSFKGRRILLAEDVEINREIVLAVLEPTLVSVECVVNGVQAVDMFKEAPERYDMIFMDIQMPEMDGYEATRQIRALDCAQAKLIPIVAMSANVFKEDIELCLRIGMNDHVGKPLVFDEVIEKLKKYIR